MEKWLHNNKVMGITAVFVAILLWVVIQLDEQGSISGPVSDIQTRTINEVQVTITGLNEELFHVKSIDPEFVNIVLRGKDSIVNQVRLNAGVDHNQIQLDLSRITEPGQHMVDLKGVGFPEDVEVTIYPQRVAVIIEEIQSKEVPVEIEIVGQPAEGYIADSPIVNPTRAIVNVPISKLQEIIAVRTVVDITDANEAVEVTSRLIAIDEMGGEVEAVIIPAVVDVVVPITSPFKQVPLQIKLLNQPAEGFSVAEVTQSVNEVTIYGPESLLEDIDIYDGPEIDLTGLSATQRFTVELPVYPGMHEIKPSFVEVNIRVVPSASKVLDNIPITISGANQNYVTRILEPESLTVDVTIEGAQAILQEVDNNDVQVILDVSNLPLGVHELTIKLNLPGNVKYGGEQELRAIVEIMSHEQAMAELDDEHRPEDEDEDIGEEDDNISEDE